MGSNKSKVRDTCETRNNLQNVDTVAVGILDDFR